MPTDRIAVYAVVVLYQLSPSESSSVRTLLRAAASLKDAIKLHVLLYDNTPARTRADVVVPDGVEYHAAGANTGLADAYNFACARARNAGFEWIITLDQDSCLPETFLAAAVAHLRALHPFPKISAVAPQIVCNGRLLSPYHLTMGGTFRKWLPFEYQGIPESTVYALNSGSILRLSALKQVGDYDRRFWLDCSDTSVFHRLAQYGKGVYVAGDLQIEHDFSMRTSGRRVSPKRYLSIADAESSFCDLYLGRLAALACTARLIARLFIYSKPADRSLLSITWTMLLRRLLCSRRRRLKRWDELQSARLAPVVASGEPDRPKVSVCIATFNGEGFVEEQLRSILPQLRSDDEIIVVDDASTDRTVERIGSLQSAYIRVIRHEKNCGAVKSFEEAISHATGDVLFLSDMDDIWHPQKVTKILDAMRQPGVTLVATSIAFIDENGKPIDAGSLPKQPPFSPGLLANYIRNRYRGATMAFRSRLLPTILPLPHDKLFFHDVWIGLQNAARGGKTAFLDEPLLLYRRHGSNLSGSLSRIVQVRLRLQLGCALARRWVGRR